MTRITNDGSYIVVDCREDPATEAGLPPEKQGRIYLINADHRVGFRTRIWQFFCPECFRLWIASCGNSHDNEVPCIHCYDFKERKQKHDDNGWILTCYSCTRADRPEPGTDSTDNATTVEASKKRTRGRPKGTARKVTGPTYSYTIKL